MPQASNGRAATAKPTRNKGSVMERFELTVVAQGPPSIWVALLVIALLCTTAVSLAVAFWALRQPYSADS